MKRRSMVMLATALFVACCIPALSAPKPSTAQVDLNIQNYVSVTVNKAGLNMYVTPVMLPGTTQYKVFDTAEVHVTTNCNATLHCPTSVHLIDHGTYDVDAEIGLYNYDNPLQVSDEWQMGFTPGDYRNIQLEVSIKKDWNASDRSGKYTGSLTLAITAD